jgi:hypothetical protein
MINSLYLYKDQITQANQKVNQKRKFHALSMYSNYMIEKNSSEIHA